ncbi:MAG: SidA/IucD/PvdA family monooxygenase [Corynebacterium sp.]|uniref:SidA/IucD/PvdA family monooxygenase n=1 Tax=Corynebacterium sp. TaxID=1720 RepID=UPI0026DD3E79|nr:SidA/IucD/PvdA family monooxygenase [Corynebacterium sp.]MDO4760459.1 SidA/IucD/PvdA family monooxygenase [Corynebacterium sp.]
MNTTNPPNSQHTTHTDLAVVGAGPKGIATALRAVTLDECARPSLRVVLLDQFGVGANWTVAGGWTDGKHRLGTPPEKDVGFPYATCDRDVDQKLLSYSWNAHLADIGALGQWIDRGRIAPTHNQWQRYLQWVADRAGLTVIQAEVTQVSTAGECWELTATGVDNQYRIVADALMITGPGPGDTDLPDSSGRVFGVRDFWTRLVHEETLSGSIMVVGGGETAGSIVNQLLDMDVERIDLIAPGAAVFSRGEGYFENSVYTDAGHWQELPAAQRRDLIERTDRGVVSQRVQQRMASDPRVFHHSGRVRNCTPGQSDRVRAHMVIGAQPHELEANIVIDARGGNPLWFLDLFDPSARDVIELVTGWPLSVENIEEAIDRGLGLGGSVPRLVLPQLSAMAQGPGFPNLSCLGALADMVICGVLDYKAGMLSAGGGRLIHVRKTPNLFNIRQGCPNQFVSGWE